MKNGNKGNGKLDQKNQASNKVDWTDSEECYESSGSGGLNKKVFSNDDQNIKINSVPIASKWAMKYLENITSSEEDEKQENEQKLLLCNQNDKIAKRQLMVGFPFGIKILTTLVGIIQIMCLTFILIKLRRVLFRN
uniref:Uncharacterized protein n=1 Tax=Meloidogyne enterolobii TaxID=390850 RepID=A0A6V7VFN4_MELEN|nr:unnamed protein product [Meloidogyne enterolobii]